MRNITVIVLLLVWLSGCFNKPISVRARFPAEYPQAAELTNIAVFDFEGRDGPAFSNQLTAELKSASLDGKPYFKVLSEDVIKGRSSVRSTRGSKNLRIAMEYGRRLGVQGVYFGTISPVNANNRHWQQERTKCLKYKNIIECKEEQKYTVKCHEQTASVTVHPQLVNVQNGSVVYAENLSSDLNHTFCEGEGQAKSSHQITAQLHVLASEKIRRHVAPYNDFFNVTLKTDGENLSSANLEKFKGALAFSKAGQMDRACAIWQEISVISPAANNSLSLTYNLGVCAEVVANYDRAIELYSKADAMLTKPDELVAEAKERAYRMKKNQEKIKFPR